jgi:hypothetical protein
MSMIRESKWAIILTVACVASYFFPLAILGHDAKVRVHDHLDSNVASIKAMLDRDLFLSSPLERTECVLGGVPRASLYGNYDLGVVVYALFGMTWGNLINQALIALIAWFGMHSLLWRVSKQLPLSHSLRWALSLFYSLLPFWSCNASVAGLPLLFSVLWRAHDNDLRVRDWFILISMPFYSSVVLVGIFVILLWFLIWLRLAATGRPAAKLFLGLSLYSLCSVLSHWPLLAKAVFSNDVSHRTQFLVDSDTFSSALGSTLKILTDGQDHAASLHVFFLPLIAVAGWIQWRKQTYAPLYRWILIFLVSTAVIYGFLRFDSFASMSDFIMKFVPVQLQRFHYLHPMAWVILFAVSSAIAISHWGPRGRLISFLSLPPAFALIIAEHPLIKYRNSPSIQQYYSPQLFDQMKSDIGLELVKSGCISIGIHPAVPLYNGLTCIDGYLPDFPLQHKLRFRKLIEPEIRNNRQLLEYFDNWGSRCYAFTCSLQRDFMISNDDDRVIPEPNFSWDIFRSMGGRWVLSSAAIDLDPASPLTLRGTYDHANSWRRVFLYEVE